MSEEKTERKFKKKMQISDLYKMKYPITELRKLKDFKRMPTGEIMPILVDLLNVMIIEGEPFKPEGDASELFDALEKVGDLGFL